MFPFSFVGSIVNCISFDGVMVFVVVVLVVVGGGGDGVVVSVVVVVIVVIVVVVVLVIIIVRVVIVVVVGGGGGGVESIETVEIIVADATAVATADTTYAVGVVVLDRRGCGAQSSGGCGADVHWSVGVGEIRCLVAVIVAANALEVGYAAHVSRAAPVRSAANSSGAAYFV